MHDTALQHAKRFFDTYVGDSSATIVEIGAQDVNGSLRDVAPAGCKYVGVDFVDAKGVDVVLTDPYVLPFESESVDVIVSSSCLEHSEFFWLSYLEMLRILKPSGLLYINVPSNGDFHQYPVDCWRFYPDSGIALQNWARRSGLATALLESYIGRQAEDVWNDFIAVFVKDAAHAAAYPRRIVDGFVEFSNGRVMGEDTVRQLRAKMEDQEPKLKKRLKQRLDQVFASAD